eukprot:8876356-Alexandrium_andersonii.AAC.1
MVPCLLLCSPTPAHAWGGRDCSRRPRRANSPAQGTPTGAHGPPTPGVAPLPLLQRAVSSPSPSAMGRPAPAHAWGRRPRPWRPRLIGPTTRGPPANEPGPPAGPPASSAASARPQHSHQTRFHIP